ncbi:MAG: serine/threonine protein kinase [Planctomycetes bacterium]|nr:serine/threonine protein kinase [Planctomycetota bacterium]
MFVGRHEATGAEHALKLVTLSTQEAAARLEREARAVARLPAHPGIAAVHHLGALPDGRPFYAMDLVEGPTLEARLEAGPLAPDEVARLGAALARALAHVHAYGVVHRDVKPSNVVLRGGRDPVLVDFGLALDTVEDRLTGSGVVLGTPFYMAPEQVRAGAAPTAATDVFALGLVLHEALAGEHPFGEAKDVVTLLAAIVRRAPPPLPDAPPALADALRGALAKDPADRPTAAALAALLEGERPARRRRWPAALAAAALLVVATGAAAGLRASPPARAHGPASTAAALAADARRAARAGGARGAAGLAADLEGGGRPARRGATWPACCADCPAGEALAAAAAALDDALARSARRRRQPRRLRRRGGRGARGAGRGDPARALALLEGRRRRRAGGARARRAGDARGRRARGRPLDPTRREATTARLAADAGPRGAAALARVLLAAPDPAAQAAGLEALAEALGPSAVPPAAAAPLLAYGQARYAAGDLDAAARALSLARALDPTAPLPDDARVMLLRRAREHLGQDDLAAAARLALAIVRAGLRLELHDRELARLEGALAALARRRATTPDLELLRAAARLGARVAGEADDEAARPAVARLEALAADGALPAAARAEAATRAALGAVLLDPRAGQARAETLLAGLTPEQEPWSLSRDVGLFLLQAGEARDGLRWARRAWAAAPDRLFLRERQRLAHLLASALVHAGELAEARTLLERPDVGAQLGPAAHLLRAELALREGDLARARAAADAFLHLRPHDPAGLRLRARLDAAASEGE